MIERKVERKVRTSTLASFGAGLVVAVLNGLQDNPSALAPLPPWAQALILAIGPGLATFAAGYSTGHTWRPDLPRRTDAR